MAQPFKIKTTFGSRQFIVDLNDLTPEKAIDLAEKIGEIRAKSSLLSKFPIEEGETREKWYERIQPLLEGERLRLKGESTDDHLKRIFNQKTQSLELAFDILTAIATTFGLNTLTEQEFNTTNWIQTKTFIHSVLTMADIDGSDFAPKQLGE